MDASRRFGYSSSMLDKNTLDDIAKRLTETLPSGLQHIKDDMQKNFQSVLQSSLSRMNLVSREDFDVQAGVLMRTREKLEQLEQRVNDLEKKLSDNS